MLRRIVSLKSTDVSEGAHVMIFTERDARTQNIKNTVLNDFRIYLVFLQHFENKLFQTTAQTLRHNMACVVTSPPWSRTSWPADLPALIPVKFSKRVCLVINGALRPNAQIRASVYPAKSSFTSLWKKFTNEIVQSCTS
jgi:hypothetical protein